jgi:hypothetical protein
MINSLAQSRSPWLDDAKSNQIRQEIQVVKENLLDSHYQPLPIFKVLVDLGGEDMLFRGLAKLAPLSPLVSYHGEISVWLSPPPSGKGNAVFVVMGHDSEGKLRLVGGNWYREPKQRIGVNLSSVGFFKLFDAKTRDKQRRLVKDVVEFSIQNSDSSYLKSLGTNCRTFNTMPIYLVLLDDKPSQTLLQGFPALAQGCSPCDMTHEYFGEIL